MEIESISKSNLKPLAALFTEMFLVDSFGEEYKLCSKILHSEDQTCFLIKDNDEYIAFIYVSLRTDYVEGAKSSPVAYIEAIYVKQFYRKTGIGKQLVEVAEDWGRKAGCTQIASDTELDNLKSMAFHRGIGFSEANRIICFIKELD